MKPLTLTFVGDIMPGGCFAEGLPRARISALEVPAIPEAVQVQRDASVKNLIGTPRLYQRTDPPVLRMPAPAMEWRIRRQLVRSSKRLHGLYPHAAAYPVYRCMNEMTDVCDDFHEQGWRLKYAHPSTSPRVGQKFFTGRIPH